MFSSLKKFTGTALALVCLTAPAYAAEITPEGAAALKTLIQTQLDLRKATASASGEAYMTEGELSVVPQDTYYKVTFPKTKLRDGHGSIFNIGSVAANVMPTDSPNEWKAAVAFPTPIQILKADGTPQGEITIGQQRSLGIWNIEFNSFSRLDAHYETVAYKDFDEKLTISIGAIDLRNLFDRAANGYLSGPASAIASSWTIASDDGQYKGAIKDLRVDVAIKDFDPKVVNTFKEQMSALVQARAGTEQPSPGHNLALYNALADLLGKSSDSLSSKIYLNGLSLTSPNDTTQQPETLTLDQAQLAFAMSGFRSGAVKSDIQLAYNGLNLGTAAADSDLIPKNFDLALNLDKLPFAQLVELGRTNMTAPEGTADVVGSATKIITDAGSSLTQTLSFSGSVLSGKGSGVVVANTAAVTGYTADQSLELEGLDTLITKLGETITSSPEGAMMQQVLGPLTILQMVGQQDPANPAKRTYKFVVDAQGKTTLNGSDLSTLMGMMGGATPQAQEPSAPQ